MDARIQHGPVVALARRSGREALRLCDGCESAAEREQRELLEVVRSHGGTITPCEMGRARRRWRGPVAAEMALKTLARNGWGELGVEPSGPKGGRPSFRFKLFTHPAVYQSPQTPGETTAVSTAG